MIIRKLVITVVIIMVLVTGLLRDTKLYTHCYIDNMLPCVNYYTIVVCIHVLVLLTPQFA